MKELLKKLYLNKLLTKVVMSISQLFVRSTRVVLSKGTLKDNNETIEVEKSLKAKYQLQYLELTLKKCESNTETMLSNPMIIDQQGNKHNLYVTLRTREGLVKKVSPSSVFLPDNDFEIIILFRVPIEVVPVISAIDISTT